MHVCTMGKELIRENFINYFETLSSFDGRKYDKILVQVHNYALKYGLEEDDMSLIASVSFKHNLSYLRIRKLLRCLLPRLYCSRTTVRIILNQTVKYKEGPVLLLKQFLQWLIGVIEFNLVESKDDINVYYHLFLSFIKSDVIDIPAAKLVYFLTAPEDVSRFLTKKILSLYKLANGKHFGAVLYLFKCYRPDIVPENIPVYSVHKSFGTLSKGILESFLCAKTRIKKNSDANLDNIAWNKFGMEINEDIISLVPDKDIQIKDIRKFIVSAKEPSCVLSLLNNPEGMYMIMIGTELTHTRLSYQLYFVLYDAFLDRNPNISYEVRDKILEKVATFQHILQQPIPVVSKFIGQYLMRWDGHEHKYHIYNILEWMYVKSFLELRQCVLTFLLHIFKSNPVFTKCQILYCLGNFTVNIIQTYDKRDRVNPKRFFNVREHFSFPEFIRELFLFLENLCLTGIYLENNHPAILNTILIIHENILIAGRRADIDFKITKHIPYAALVSSVPNGLNEICRLINEFPYCVPKIVKQDFIDCLLKSNAFNPNSKKSSIFHGFDKNKYSISHEIENKLIVNKHYAFLCYTYLINSQTSEQEKEKIFNVVMKYCPDIFKFLKPNMY